jgi:hypothetical protein
VAQINKTIPHARPHVSLCRGPGVKFAQGPVGLFLSGVSRLRRVVELVEDPWSGGLRHPQELLLAVPLEKLLALDEVYFRKKPLSSQLVLGPLLDGLARAAVESRGSWGRPAGRPLLRRWC